LLTNRRKMGGNVGQNLKSTVTYITIPSEGRGTNDKIVSYPYASNGAGQRREKEKYQKEGPLLDERGQTSQDVNL